MRRKRQSKIRATINWEICSKKNTAPGACPKAARLSDGGIPNIEHPRRPPDISRAAARSGTAAIPLQLFRRARPRELRTPNSELRTPNSELRTPNSELRTPNSELRTPNSELRTLSSPPVFFPPERQRNCRSPRALRAKCRRGVSCFTFPVPRAKCRRFAIHGTGGAKG
jgi:hypothetical protein